METKEINLVKQEPQGDGPMGRVQLARHDRRPHALDYIARLLTDFSELHGDRKFGDDHAIVGGFGRLDGQSVMIIAQQKGRDVRERQERNFGMPKPEGYRKALRLMQLAEKFNRPILTFIDTTGAYPGIDAEERGQAQAIAHNLREMSRLQVPIIVNITGEGGSGGALAIGVGDEINMLENAIYSVISPEGCAAILWKDQTAAPQAAKSLKITAEDLLALGVIDQIVPEPPVGAHQDWDGAASLLGAALRASLARLLALPTDQRLTRRYAKFRQMGRFLG